jgi:hypothetical protein
MGVDRIIPLAIVAQSLPCLPCPRQPKARFTLRNSLKISASAIFRRLKTSFALQKLLHISLKNKHKLSHMSYIRHRSNASNGVNIQSCSSLRHT